MKLYTEQQLKDALNVARFYQEQIMPNDTIVKKLTPIELPSDEDIEERSKFLFPIENTVSGPTYIAHKSFIEGAKWMKDKLLTK